MTTHPATRAAKPAASGRAWGTPAQGTPSRQAWGHLRQWAQPQTLRRSLFLLGQEPFLESSPSEPRSTHCWEGAPEPAPPGSLPGALPPLRGAARRVRPRHRAGLLSPFAHPHRTHSPRRPRALQRAPGRACPQGGVARLSFSPSLPHRAWHQEGPHLSVEGTNDPTFWAEVQIWEMSRAHHGIPGPEVRRKLSGHLCHPVPARTSRLVGSGLCLGAAPSLSIPPSAAS